MEPGSELRTIKLCPAGFPDAIGLHGADTWQLELSSPIQSGAADRPILQVPSLRMCIDCACIEIGRQKIMTLYHLPLDA